MIWAAILIRRREMWWPTWQGWLALLLCVLGGGLLLLWKGNAFLSSTRRVPAEVLVVEGWIGREALSAAAAEFRSGGYEVLVATGGYSSNLWGAVPSSHAEHARRELIRWGIPEERILLAQAPPGEGQRTFGCALAVREVLQSLEEAPRGINVFTRGPHARRSRLVHRKVQDIPVGVIGWVPERLRQTPWWHSSERTKEFVTESCGYLFEAVLNSGRLHNTQKTTAAAVVRGSSSS